MSNLKDTDIDDLFRRASDKYPLRTDSASWDRMAAALENRGPEPPDGPIAPEEKRKRRFFWLFLLLPLAGAGYYAYHHSGNTGKAVVSGNPVASHSSTSVAASTPGVEPATAPAGTAPATAPAATTPAGTAPATGTSTPTIAAGQTAATRDQTTSDHATPGTLATPGDDPAAIPAGAAPATAPGDAATQNGQTRFLAAHSRQHPGSQANIGRSRTNKTSTNQNNTDRNNTDQVSTDPTNTSQTNTGTTDDGSIADNANGTSAFTISSPAPGDRLFYDLQRAPISRDYRLSVNVTAPTAKKDSAANPKDAAKSKDAAKRKDTTKHFYAGIFGSPDLSTVKMQSVKGVGTTFGIIVGYTFKGGRWAVETGAYVDRKKYYTDGEYFSTKEIRLPTSSWLTDVDGICYMWEIPLNARYNFNPGAKKTSWFATAGLSTYLMTSEKYNYGLAWPGSTRSYDANVNIHKPSQYPFSIINLSAGFEQHLGKIGNLRVEPYVRLPLTGLGTGKLPIMSAGVNIGITRQLW